MADAYTAEALAAQAFMATSAVFAGAIFSGKVFDETPHANMADPVTKVPYAEIARRYVKDPADPFEVARAAGGQGSIRGTTGLYSNPDELTPYPFGSHQPSL